MVQNIFQSPGREDFEDPEKWLLRAVPHAVMDWLRDFVQLETEGLENIPRKGRCLVIPNHSGVLGWDALVLQNEILKFARRIPRTMTHAFWHQNDFFRNIASRLAYIPPDLRQSLRLLRRNNLLIIFPEAERGNFKPSSEMYRLRQFNPGFLSLSILTDSPIIPVAVLGAEETHLNLTMLEWTEKWIGTPLPLPLNLIPLRVRWKIVFMEPIRLGHYDRSDVKNPRFLREATEIIRHKIQRRIDEELKKRGLFAAVREERE